MSDRNIEALWHFALGVYAVEGVAKECIDLQQSHSADVCVLLAAAFAAARGALPDRPVIAAWDEAVRQWREAVVHRLRAVRDDLKSFTDDEGVADFRKAVLSTELRAERLQLRRLAVAIGDSHLPRRDEVAKRDRVTGSIAAAVSLYAEEPVQMRRLVEAASLWVDNELTTPSFMDNRSDDV